MGGEIGDSTGVLVLVQSGVSIQKLRTVVLDYGELLAQLVYLTWLLRGGPGFETQHSISDSSSRIYRVQKFPHSCLPRGS